MLTYRMTVKMKQVSQKHLAVKKKKKNVRSVPNLHEDRMNLKATLVMMGR